MSLVMVRITVKFLFGRRALTSPGPGSGVLLKELRSRWMVFDPRYWKSRAAFFQISRCRSKLHWYMRPAGNFAAGVVKFGGVVFTGPAEGIGLSSESVGLEGCELNEYTGLKGGLVLRNV